MNLRLQVVIFNANLFFCCSQDIVKNPDHSLIYVHSSVKMPSCGRSSEVSRVD